MDSVTVPIWLTLSNKQLQAFFSTASAIRVGLVTNSEAATSIPITTFPLYPAFSIAVSIKRKPSLFSRIFGAKPPSSPTAVASNPNFALITFLRLWYTSDPIFIASVKELAPIYKYLFKIKGMPFLKAPALATANETPKIALAPSLDLFGVPSNFNIISSIALCSQYLHLYQDNCTFHYHEVLMLHIYQY
ncbi:hypothetical protein AGLY_012998 [Aphis glycines]|uniref:Uncharacterized protein n=1 Tax=Aphis glycines TaxID=307491 RepID=A0A6G0T7L6_APHGL|nr:hypothetical protein AGLY_012998 [Aphis glycines]